MLDVAVLVFFVALLFFSVAQTLGFATGGGQKVVDSTVEQVASLGRNVLEDLFGGWFALMYGGDLVCPGNDV